MGTRREDEPSIDCGSSRELFTELVGEAVAEVRADPSPLASAYLVDLLEQALRAPHAEALEGERPSTLAESFLTAQRERGALRAARLRELGDRVLFVAGFFSASLQRGLVGQRYYREIGSAAYAGLSSLSRSADGSALFGELAEEFPVFVEVLAEVGGRSRQEADDLLALYDRYARWGSALDRSMLMRRGITLPDPKSRRRLQ